MGEKKFSRKVKVKFYDVRKTIIQTTELLSKIQFASEKDRRLAGIIKDENAAVNMLSLDQLVGNKNYVILDVKPILEKE